MPLPDGDPRQPRNDPPQPRIPKPAGWQPNGNPKQCQGWARTRGAQCAKAPALGATVCRNHGGASPQVKAAAARRLHEIKIEAQVSTMLAEYDVATVDPLVGLLEVVLRTWAWVQLLGGLVGRLAPTRGATDHSDAGGIYGPTHLGDGAPHVLVEMYGTWLDRHAKACKLAIDAGVAERQVRLAESQGELIATVVRATATELGLDLDDPKVREVMGRQLRLVQGGAG